MSTKNYVDESVFQGVKEFATPIGQMRAVAKGNGMHEIFIRATPDRSFVREALVKAGDDATCVQIYDQFTDYTDSANDVE